MKNFDATIVIPAYNEAELIIPTLEKLSAIEDLSLNVLIVVDDSKDTTINAVNNWVTKANKIEVLVQNYGKGPANAIRFGMHASVSNCVVVMMADGSDDVRVIPDLVNLVNRGVAVACASRYMSGGQQIGGPRFKKFLSKSAGRILYFFAGVGTHDPTNSFKAYSKSFLNNIEIESRSGFEIGIELISKARRARLPIAEIPTIWLDRTAGTSNFKMTKWIPKYFKWFAHCFGPAVGTSQIDSLKEMRAK